MVTVRATTPLGDALRYAAEAFLNAAVEADREEAVEYFSPKEIAELLKISDETVYRWIRAGDLKALDVGGKYRVRSSDLTNYLEARS